VFQMMAEFRAVQVVRQARFLGKHNCTLRLLLVSLCNKAVFDGKLDDRIGPIEDGPCRFVQS
jgi:hypothetical protein